TVVGYGLRRPRVHVTETIVTVIVKDVNDNEPVFANGTIYGEAQENGPIDLSVAVVRAWDADDPLEGRNAHMTYSIEKNVVEDKTGAALFRIDSQTGLLRTALCCLDREVTPEYHIQVVAHDGGGLKGTGTVVVHLSDVNDNPPRLKHREWDITVDETWGPGPPSNATLLEITLTDRDSTNYFYFRVVQDSGFGWEHFGVRSVGPIGELHAIRTLDYEDDHMRAGFRFRVQVTDKGRGGWDDPRHIDESWIAVHLADVNDNAPVFSRKQVSITLAEDTPTGAMLTQLTATDRDMGGTQGVDYRVSGGWGSVRVDTGGGVILWRALDREAPDGDEGIILVVATDSGRPPLSATATLSVTVSDVNDSPPRLLPPTVLHVREGSPSQSLGFLTATDDDVWDLGHGPPFTMALADTNPKHILDILDLRFKQSLDNGRGGAELWTREPLDREQYRTLVVQVLLTDAEGLAATQAVTVVVDDINDNPMRPAAKTVYLWKTLGGGPDASLGRVYVDDPDDWDVQDKTFQWAKEDHHPHFSLDKHTGIIYASSQTREG
ncbi:unnamed protein product, partial [Meganyctiphanes norvegica]